MKSFIIVREVQVVFHSICFIHWSLQIALHSSFVSKGEHDIDIRSVHRRSWLFEQVVLKHKPCCRHNFNRLYSLPSRDKICQHNLLLDAYQTSFSASIGYIHVMFYIYIYVKQGEKSNLSVCLSILPMSVYTPQ